MSQSDNEKIASYRDTALVHLRRGQLDQAERALSQLIDLMPDDAEANLFIASRYFSRGEHLRGLELLLKAERGNPGNAAVLQQVGMALLVEGDIVNAAVKLQQCVKIDPQKFVARLKLAEALEQLGQAQDAFIAYAVAIRTAQERGRWLSDETTAIGLRDSVLYAIKLVNARKKEIFLNAIEPLRQRYGHSELSRVELCLKIYLGEMPADIPDSRQQPKFLYFPDIPSQPFYPSERFPWIEELEAGTASIRDELLAVLSRPQSLESFLQITSAQQAPELLKSSGPERPAWDAYFFHRHGQRYDEHCLQCPQTAGFLDWLPLVRVRDHSPETLFSVLQSGTHILPHTGVTNTRLVTHLPLIVPKDCALRVGGETHVWEEGRCVTFDDTFEHEAWNNSSETRVVLIVDSWNPDLSEAERAAVCDLVGEIGDFNRACELPTQS